VLFRLEPTSPINRKLITSLYLGLVILTLGIAIWVGAWPMFGAPIALFATANWVHIPFEEAKIRPKLRQRRSELFLVPVMTPCSLASSRASHGLGVTRPASICS